MGDNLTFARDFTRTAAEGLELLSQMDDPRANSAQPVVTAMMTTIQRGAKRLRARHIYTAAQDVLSALHHETDKILDTRIHALGSLVTGYAKGLNELLTDTHAPTQTLSVHEKWETARATLDALLPKAQAPDADVLSRLMRAPVTIEEVHGQSDSMAPSDIESSDIVPFPSQTSRDDVIDNNDEIFAIPAPVSVPITPPAAKHVAGPKILLETVMRNVVADALSVARQTGRTISLSYDMEDAQIEEDLSEDLRARLGTALAQIIRQSLPEGRVGHIDINIASEQLHVMAGTTALRVALDPKAVKPATKPLITQETEQGLRAQLAALMDPEDNFGTAS